MYFALYCCSSRARTYTSQVCYTYIHDFTYKSYLCQQQNKMSNIYLRLKWICVVCYIIYVCYIQSKHRVFATGKKSQQTGSQNWQIHKWFRMRRRTARLIYLSCAVVAVWKWNWFYYTVDKMVKMFFFCFFVSQFN